ncbi:MAG TPA: Hint domain-containing protein [Polyangiaceae bacterium]|nr:Hint domain-containing protein [Polyangiaceae bacterium]
MKNAASRLAGVSSAILATGLVVSACGSDDTKPPEGAENSGTASLTLTTVPADVACVRVTVAGSRTDVRKFDVMPGHATTMTLAGLPLGAVTFQEDAFAEACSSVTSASVPTWFSESVAVTLVSRVVAAVRLVLHRNGQATITSDFVDDGGVSTPPPADAGSGGPCVPIPQATACSGKECGTASDGCGHSYSCGACESDPCLLVRCVSNTCQYSAPACLATGTPITLADGTTRPIERIRVGDRVLAYDVTTGTTRPQRVSETFHHAARENQDGIVLVDGALVATGNHPFYANGRWVRADELRAGDRLVRLSGAAAATAMIGSVEALGGEQETWNLEVEGDHDYFAGGVLVHNKPPPCL